MLTQIELKKVINYEPATGIFTWLIDNVNKMKVGDVAGALHKHGYIIIGVFGKHYKAHRLAFLYMTGEWPTKFVDHKDTIRNNNQWNNLRESTRLENNNNANRRKDNTSGFKGVSWHKASNKFIARCWANGVRHNLGCFETAELASNKREEFAKNNHGQFYR